MRDFWYEVVTEKWPTPDESTERLNEAILGGREEAIAEALLSRIQTLEEKLEDQPSQEAVGEIATGLVTATRLGDSVYANVRCHSCGHVTGLSVGATACPQCGAPYP
jgi:rubrerythrin